MRCFYLLLLAYAGLLPQALSAKTPTTTSADIGWFSKQLFVTLFTEPYEALKGKAEKVQMGIEMIEDFNLQQQIKAQLANIEPQIEAALKARPAATGALVFVNVESAVAGTAKSYHLHGIPFEGVGDTPIQVRIPNVRRPSMDYLFEGYKPDEEKSQALWYIRQDNGKLVQWQLPVPEFSAAVTDAILQEDEERDRQQQEQLKKAQQDAAKAEADRLQQKAQQDAAKAEADRLQQEKLKKAQQDAAKAAADRLQQQIAAQQKQQERERQERERQERERQEHERQQHDQQERDRQERERQQQERDRQEREREQQQRDSNGIRPPS